MADFYPRLQVEASRLSRYSQSLYMNLLIVELVVILAATGLSDALSILPRNFNLLVAILCSACLLTAAGSQILRRWKKYDGAWYAGRQVAESVKTTSWRYALAVSPFDSIDQADERFIDVLQHLRTDSKVLSKHMVGTAVTIGEITGSLRRTEPVNSFETLCELI